MIMGPTQVGWQDSIACSSEVPDETPFELFPFDR